MSESHRSDGFEDDHIDYKKAAVDANKADEKPDQRLASAQINKLISLDIKKHFNEVITEIDEGHERKIFRVDRSEKKFLIYPVTSDSTGRGDAFLEDRLKELKGIADNKENNDVIFLIPTILSKKEHIVLVEGSTKTKKVTIHDSQGDSHKLFDGPILNMLRQAGFEPDYKAYDKQKKDFECGFFVHAYLRDILFNEGKWVGHIKIKKPQLQKYMTMHEAHSPPDLKEELALALEPLKKYAESSDPRHRGHRKRAKDILAAISQPKTREDVVNILLRQYYLFEPPSGALPQAPKNAAPAFFNKAIKTNPEKKGKYYDAIISALSVLEAWPKLDEPKPADKPVPAAAVARK